MHRLLPPQYAHEISQIRNDMRIPLISLDGIEQAGQYPIACGPTQAVSKCLAATPVPRGTSRAVPSYVPFTPFRRRRRSLSEARSGSHCSHSHANSLRVMESKDGLICQVLPLQRFSNPTRAWCESKGGLTFKAIARQFDIICGEQRKQVAFPR